MSIQSTLIVIVENDPAVKNVLTRMVQSIDASIEVLSFRGSEVLDDKRIFDASLFIIDIGLDDIDGRALALLFPQVCRSIPFLFISGIHYSDNHLTQFETFLTVDFIAKPFSTSTLKNRIKILLAVSGQCYKYLFDSIAKQAIGAPLAYLPFIAIVLDRKMTVHFANSQLKKLIGVKDNAFIHGQNWLQYIKPENRKDVQNIHKFVFDNIATVEGEYIETHYAIITDKKNNQEMLWGNTIFYGEPELPALVLSVSLIGMDTPPLSRKKRSYWQNQIVMHRAAIKDMRRRFEMENKINGQSNTCKLT